MKGRLLAFLGIVLLIAPAGTSATSIGIPRTGDGPYLVGFEVESMEDRIGEEDVSSVRYLGRISWRVTPPLSLSLRVGGSEIDVQSSVHGEQVAFEGRPKLALGLGTTFFLPLGMEGIAFFAEGGALHTLSKGSTVFETTIQSSTFRETYENRYRWTEIQAGGGLRFELPWAATYLGLVGRAVDGEVVRETYQAGALAVSETEDFSRGIDVFGLAGLEIPLPGRFVLALVGMARDEDHFTWTLSIAEGSR
jgi:hypothetical protein